MNNLYLFSGCCRSRHRQMCLVSRWRCPQACGSHRSGHREGNIHHDGWSEVFSSRKDHDRGPLPLNGVVLYVRRRIPQALQPSTWNPSGACYARTLQGKEVPGVLFCFKPVDEMIFPSMSNI